MLEKIKIRLVALGIIKDMEDGSQDAVLSLMISDATDAVLVYAPMVAETHEYQYNADAFEARGSADVKVEAPKEVPMVRTDKAR